MKTTLLESVLATYSKKSGVFTTRPNNPTCRNLFYGNSHMHQDVHHYIICWVEKLEETKMVQRNMPDVYIWTFCYLGKGHVMWKQQTMAFTHVKCAYEKARSRPLYSCFWDSISRHMDLITAALGREGRAATFVWHPLGDVQLRSY